MRKAIGWKLILGMALSSQSSFAEVPHVSYVFPAGAQRGTEVDVKVGGHFLHEAARFSMTGPGVSVSPQIKRATTLFFEGPVIPQPDSQRVEDYPVDYIGTVKANADAALGIREWSVQNAQGATVPMKFVIGRFEEVAEEEIDGAPVPQLVKLPVTINARTFPREDVDLWAFDLEQGQVITAAVTAVEIGSPVEAHLELIDPQGRRLAEATGSPGLDPVLRITAPVSGRYLMRLHDANFGGLQHHIYRLSLSTGAFADSVFPLGGRRGSTLALQWQGVGLPGATVSVPLKDAADDRLQWHHPDVPSRELGFPLEISDLDEVVEASANDTLETATAAPVWGVLNGRIEQAGDQDWWRIDVKKGQSLLLDVHAADLGSALDSVVTVFDAKGEQQAENDDNGSDVDSRLVWNVPNDGTYFIRVTDRLKNRGGSQFGYRLWITDAKADDSAPFTLEVQSPASVKLDRGTELKLKVNVKRSGFNDPIEVVLEGLPTGVTATDTVIAAKQNNGTITLKVDAAAPLVASEVKLIGKAKVGERDVEAVSFVRTNPPSKRPIHSLQMAVTVKTPFKFSGAFESKFAARGSVYTRHFSLDRGGFEGPIHVSLADRQARHLQGVTGPTLVVPPGVNEFDYSVSLPPWLEIGRTSRTCIMAVGEIVDPDGTRHKVTFTSKEQNDQIIVLTAPEDFSITPDVVSLRAIPGETARLAFQIGRASFLTEPATIEITPAKHMQGLAADKVTLNPDNGRGEIAIRFAKGAIGPFNMPLTIRATTTDPRGFPVIHECAVEIVTDAPAPEVMQVRRTAK